MLNRPFYSCLLIDLGPVSRKPGNFSVPQSHSKISNLTITELFCLHILNMNRGSLVSETSCAWASTFLDTDELKMAYGPEKLPGLSRNGSLAFEWQRGSVEVTLF